MLMHFQKEKISKSPVATILYTFKLNAYHKCKRIESAFKLSLVLERQSNDITEAECECLAGRTPAQSCT